jgi:hypothetical protein
VDLLRLLALDMAGNNREARIAIMAITTSSSTSVNPGFRFELVFIGHRVFS